MTAKTWGGWFLKTCTTVNESCLAGEGINVDIRYVDAAGVKWTASRLGNNFVHTKAKADSTDLICVADTTTGLTPRRNRSHQVFHLHVRPHYFEGCERQCCNGQA